MKIAGTALLLSVLSGIMLLIMPSVIWADSISNSTFVSLANGKKSPIISSLDLTIRNPIDHTQAFSIERWTIIRKMLKQFMTHPAKTKIQLVLHEIGSSEPIENDSSSQVIPNQKSIRSHCSIFPFMQVAYSCTQRFFLEMRGHLQSYSPKGGDSHSNPELYDYTLYLAPTIRVSDLGHNGMLFGQVGLGYKMLDYDHHDPHEIENSIIGSEFSIGIMRQAFDIRLGFNRFEPIQAMNEPDVDIDASSIFMYLTYHFNS